MGRRSLLVVLTGCLTAAETGVLIDDTFADGDSQNQDLAAHSLRLFNGRSTSVRTDRAGSVEFDVTPTGANSEGFWAFFTAAGEPVQLGVGDRLTVAVTFTLDGFRANGSDIRFGVFDSLGSRNANNLTGGMNDATFVNDPGYGLQFYASGAGSPFVIGRRTTLSIANVFNSFGDFTPLPGSGASTRQTLQDGVPYTLRYTVERRSAEETWISVNVADLAYTAAETSPSPATAFDYFGFRIGGTNFTARIAFSRLRIEYVPAPPRITSQPQPSRLTVQVGSSVTLAVGAAGSDLRYGWRKDGTNLAAQGPVLRLDNIQLSDAGRYTAVVSNAGGSVESDPVTIVVSTTPVPPAPRIVTQPASQTVTRGGVARLSVTAAGDGLIYQWFKDGALLPGANASELVIANAQVTDSGQYSVLVSNGSGSLVSAAARLLVVSPLRVTRTMPAPGATGLCVDTALRIELDRAVRLGRTGRITVSNSRGDAVDVIDLAARPQTKPIGGTSFVYYPVLVEGNAAEIFLRRALEAGETYTVAVEPGVLEDESGAPFRGIEGADGWRFSTRAHRPAAGTAALTVAADGNGDFCTVQSAVDFVPTGNAQDITITVRPGVYREIVYVPSSKPYLTIRGEDRERTVIQYANNANLNAGNARAMFGVDAAEFTLEDITLHNTTPKGGSQAEAFRGNNRHILLNRVTLRSFQDTVLLQGLALINESFIEGDVDFLWGGGAVFLLNSEIRAVTSGGIYTQIRNGEGQNGYVFVNCRLTSPPGVSNVYLSRIDPNVFPFSQVYFIRTVMGEHIHRAGWQLNNATRAPNVQFGEYRSLTPEGAPVDISGRLPDSRQLRDAEAASWSDPANVLAGWTPYTVNARAGQSAVTVTWTAPAGHSPADWVGIYAPGAPDQAFLAWQFTGAATTGSVTISAPPGRYEVRLFRDDGFTRAAMGNRVLVE